MEHGDGGPEERQAGFWATVRAVLWSFAGIRRRRDYHRDAESLNPKVVIVVGVMLGVIFVLGLIAFIKLVVGV